MKKINIADKTLCNNLSLSFKERIEVARLLERLNVDCIELPEIKNIKSDTLLIRTIASFVKKSVLSVSAGYSTDSLELAISALNNAENPEIRVELPVSPVGMEYICHKKAPAILELASKLVSISKEKGFKVQFCATDATRAEEDFLIDIINAVINAGAESVTVCDNAAEMLPDEFAAFISKIAEKIDCENINFGVCVDNKNAMANATSALAVKAGADRVVTAVAGDITDLGAFAVFVKNCGNSCGIECSIKHTETGRIINQIKRIVSNDAVKETAVKTEENSVIVFDANDDRTVIESAVVTLGYDLSEEDMAKVYEEFLRIASKKRVSAKELDAIIASVALQVPPTYKLVSYVINNGNIISSSAQIRLSKGEEELEGICIGDGPVDAAFRAIEQIVGRHYELDDFQIQTVTEGKDSMGSAVVKLREDGKLYSATGISTDILGASIKAYINALNKIVYEEENA